MTESQFKQTNDCPAADYLLKHKDAVRLCIKYIAKWGNYECDMNDVNILCKAFAEKCYVGSDKW